MIFYSQKFFQTQKILLSGHLTVIAPAVINYPVVLQVNITLFNMNDG
jgi:hypothetical protein